MKSRVVFLDRDGVINRSVVRDGKPYPPQTLSELEVLPGVKEALQRLRLAGFRLVVVTNQPDVARGRQRRETVEAMHDVLRRDLGLDEFEVCYHDDADECDCRKPSPGLLLRASARIPVDFAKSYVVGDRWRDIAAGRTAGCRTVLIDYGYDEPQPTAPDARVALLKDAANWILEDTETR